MPRKRHRFNGKAPYLSNDTPIHSKPWLLMQPGLFAALDRSLLLCNNIARVQAQLVG